MEAKAEANSKADMFDPTPPFLESRLWPQEFQAGACPGIFQLRRNLTKKHPLEKRV